MDKGEAGEAGAGQVGTEYCKPQESKGGERGGKEAKTRRKSDDETREDGGDKLQDKRKRQRKIDQKLRDADL